MNYLRRIARSYITLTRTHPTYSPFVNRQTCFSFSSQPPKDTISQSKQEAKDFYSKHIESIIELQKLEDWQTIVGGSSETLLIDFYADWCGPCKKLTPRLEKRVNESGGKLKLLKINIDKFGQIAQAFQIKGVPTVYMVHGGKAIDAFTGQLNEQQLTKFLQTANRINEPDVEEQKVVSALQQVQNFLRQKKYEQAQKVLESIKYDKAKEEFKLVGDIFLSLAYSELGKMAKLKSHVEVMKTNAVFYSQKPEFSQLFSHLCQTVQEFDKQKQQDNNTNDWKKKIEAEPNNLQLKFEAAKFYKENAMMQECLEQLLNIIKTDKNWQDKKANKEMLVIFKQLGTSAPLVQTYRKHLQRAMY